MSKKMSFETALGKILDPDNFDHRSLEPAFRVVRDVVWPLCKTGKDAEDEFRTFILEALIGCDPDWYPDKIYTAAEIAAIWDNL